MSNVEVELRAILSPDQRETTLAYIASLGPVRQYARAMIDFSGKDRSRTVTLRINNGKQELIAKTGGLSDVVRREARVIPDNSLAETLDYLAIMGYPNGMLSLRKIYTVRTEELEYSVRDILMPGSFAVAATIVEIEALGVEEGYEEAAKGRVATAFAERNLPPLSPAEWQQWVDDIYARIDQPFVNSPQHAAALAESLAAFNLR